jgi:DNA-binding NarL/FixJ family response regulator
MTRSEGATKGDSNNHGSCGEPYRVLLADDHPLVRRGVRELLREHSEFQVCGETITVDETLECVKSIRPDCVLLDVCMPNGNALDLAKQIRVLSPLTTLIMLTMHGSGDLARQFFRAGVRGYVLKSDADTELIDALRRVKLGKTYCSSGLSDFLVDMLKENLPRGNHNVEVAGGKSLTPREIEIMRLLGGGKTNRQVGVFLGLSTRTVESHRSHIMAKLKCSTLSDLIRFAIRNQHLEE